MAAAAKNKTAGPAGGTRVLSGREKLHLPDDGAFLCARALLALPFDKVRAERRTICLFPAITPAATTGSRKGSSLSHRNI